MEPHAGKGIPLLGGQLISVIDDDESALLTLAALLRSIGFDTKTFRSAADYINFGLAERPCCIIVDIQMPGMSGIALKRWLDSYGSSAPIIMTTALTEQRVWDQALATGPVCLLKKPFDADELLCCLNKAIGFE